MSDLEIDNITHTTEVLHVIIAGDHSPLPLGKTDDSSPPISLLDISEPGSDIAEVQVDVIPADPVKMDYSKNLTPTHQTKKELYLRLDEILINALHEEFEVNAGATVDRIDMVDFLSSIVVKNIPFCPDLEKIMCLRDTVLTARVKRAFPEVEYKRKQIRQDHFRKAWLYVNIRRRPTVKEEKKGNNAYKPNAPKSKNETRTSVTTSGTWTPEMALPNNDQSRRRQTPLNTQLPRSTSPPILSNKPAKETRLSRSTRSRERALHSNKSKSAQLHTQGGGAVTTPPVSMVTGYNPQERSAIVLDNFTIAKWVKSNYVEDNTSYVPVQDVVKTFKKSFGLDITYKECHQMIYSAFTSPRQRTCPLKTVRVSSMGAQYVYRGIAPSKQDDKPEEYVMHTYQGDSSPEPPCHSESIQDEQDDIWRKIIEELKLERDQAILERNQALSVLMELEKEHAQAITVIDRLKNDRDCRRDVIARTGRNVIGFRSDRGELSSFALSHFERYSESSASKAESNILSALAPTCERCSSGKAAYEHLKEERDEIWRSIVKQSQVEREEATKRLEVVKQERDCYLERLHGFEKENQRLRDAVAVPTTAPVHTAENNRPLPTGKVEGRAHVRQNSGLGTNSDKNGRKALHSVLSRLRSKRKQSTPTKFSKVPRLSNLSPDDVPGGEHCTPRKQSVMSASIAESSPSSTEDLLTSSQEDHFHSQDPDVITVDSPNDSERELETSPDSPANDPSELLLYFEGSDMVAFRPHPMED